LFPEGLSIKPKVGMSKQKSEHCFCVELSNKRGLEGSINEKTHQNIDGFFLVAGTGLEPVTFGL
jgi:site-specific DNA recombinase